MVAFSDFPTVSPLCWQQHNISCYWFSNTRLDFEPAMDNCSEKGAYLLTDILDAEENNFIKGMLMLVNKDGTDYWAGGVKEGGLL